MISGRLAAGWWVFLALCLGVVAASCKSEPPPAAPSPTATSTATETPVPAKKARLNAVSGDVRIKRLGRAEYETAVVGATLVIGDLITTGASGHATIGFGDGSVAVVTPRSLVTIEPPATSATDGIGVKRGRVDVEIRSALGGFRVKTPGGEANVANEKKAAGAEGGPK